jgi:hypothetical protein
MIRDVKAAVPVPGAATQKTVPTKKRMDIRMMVLRRPQRSESGPPVTAPTAAAKTREEAMTPSSSADRSSSLAIGSMAPLITPVS